MLYRVHGMNIKANKKKVDDETPVKLMLYKWAGK